MSKPVLLSYCATFLKPEMLHVFRQVNGIEEFENWVVTRRRENAAQFPYRNLVVLKKSPWRIFRRAVYRLFDRPVPLGRTEVRDFLSIAREREAAVIHVYFGTEAARALPYLRQETRPKLVSFHGVDLSSSLSEPDFQALLGCVDIFLARSQTLADLLVLRGCPPERIRLSRTSVPIPAMNIPDNPQREGRYRVLQACRFIQKKGLDISLRAIAQLVESGMDITLDLAGDGPEYQALQTLTEQLQLESRVRFLGFLPNEELLHRMQDYSLFIHPSRTTASGDREGIPNAMLEAMACGLPVVATGHSGIPEAITDGIEGRLVRQDDPSALAAAIKSILADPVIYRAMASAARLRIEHEFSAGRAIEELCNAYREAMHLATRRNTPMVGQAVLK